MGRSIGLDNNSLPLLADSVAKVSWMGSRRNVRSAAHSVLNLPCHVNVADESMLRAS